MAYSCIRGTNDQGDKVVNVFEDPILKLIAEKHKKSIPQIVLNYIVKMLEVGIIPKTANK